MSMNKLVQAISNLKPDAVFSIKGKDGKEEEAFNDIDWVTGEENGTAIVTKTNPHSELTWTAVKTEMDKL
tara:strand:+ start:608 stop:817 length:210 start_codon:yes stop_codon:yes gene_type:complete